jgi:hypothetical protein
MNIGSVLYGLPVRSEHGVGANFLDYVLHYVEICTEV